MGTRSPTTFLNWLRRHERDDNAIGDLARDVAEDWRQKCLTATSAHGIYHHLRLRHAASTGVLDVVDAAARRYEIGGSNA